MAKREEIREVIWKFLLDYDKDNSNPAVDWAFILQHRLADKGVVIKVERELPEMPKGVNDIIEGWRPINLEEISMFKGTQKLMLNAGYVATMPLEEGK